MKRRTAIQSLLALPAAAALPASALVQAPQRVAEETPKTATSAPDLVGPGVPRFFSSGQLAALRKLCDALVPASGDRPGALAAGVPEFLDFLISQSPRDRVVLERLGVCRERS